MPRTESQAKQHLGAQFYHSQFTGTQYLPDSNSSTSSPPLSPASSQQPSSPPTSAASGSAAKKKHVCSICDRAFTTSGHLARHSRVHTGERNHKCPFPGCETRCSRQDNLQQHYRIHLSPGSRRRSTRSTGLRNAKKAAAAAAQAAMAAAAQEVSPPSPPSPPMSPPPALQQARLCTHHSQSPPGSPPPLAQATLPATSTLPLTATLMEAGSDRSSSSPDTSYTTPNHNLMPISSQALAMSGGNTQNYSHRSGAETYQDQSQDSGFAYVNTNSSNSMNSLSNGNSYSSAHDGYPMQHHSVQSRGHSPVSMSSRHSISHISYPQQSSYSQQNYSSSAGPASPASSQSVSSHHSGPPTPTYPVFHDDGSHGYHQSTNNGLMQADHSVMNTNHLQGQQQQQQQQSHVMHNVYTLNSMHNPVRSPPPILAPIQDVRVIRTRDEARHMQSHHTSTYLRHPQPIPTESYSFHETLGLAHGAWKGHNGLRKNLGMV